jgi:uncharacterized protein Veg
MLLSVAQLNQIYTLLQEYPSAVLIELGSKRTDKGNYLYSVTYYSTDTWLDTVNIEEKQ